MSNVNRLGQPIGDPVPGWAARPRPGRTPIDGRFCRIEPLDPARHAAPLFEANRRDAEGGMWTYMAYGPFASGRKPTPPGPRPPPRPRIRCSTRSSTEPADRPWASPPTCGSIPPWA